MMATNAKCKKVHKADLQKNNHNLQSNPILATQRRHDFRIHRNKSPLHQVSRYLFDSKTTYHECTQNVHCTLTVSQNVHRMHTECTLTVSQNVSQLYHMCCRKCFKHRPNTAICTSESTGGRGGTAASEGACQGEGEE